MSKIFYIFQLLSIFIHFTSASSLIQANYDSEKNIIIYNNKIFIESKVLKMTASNKLNLGNLKEDESIYNNDNVPTLTFLEEVKSGEGELVEGSAFWFYTILSLCNINF